MRILLILTGVLLAIPSSNVHADGTAILIAGNAPQHERELFRSALAASIQAHGGKVINAPFAAKDAALAQRCISNAAPWDCMKATVASKGIDQLVVGSVDTGASPTGAPEIRLSVYLVVSNLDFAIVEERHCDPCSDDVLKSLAGEFAQAQLRRLAVVRGRTKVAVRTTPRGASITFDGDAQGASDTELSTFPGSHTIRLELDGHQMETRTVDALDGKTVEVNVTMYPKAQEPLVRPAHSRPSRLVPILIGSAGAAAVITGGVLIAVHAPPGQEVIQRHEYYYATRTPGIVTAIGGAAAIGVSVYLWRRQSRSAVTAVPLVGGAAATWMTTF